MRQKGYHHTEETRRKMSETRRGKPFSGVIYNRRGISHSKTTKKKISLTLKGHKFWGSKRHSDETREKMGRTHKGSKSHFWKGGVTPEHKTIRESLEYKLWREAVFKRDNWTCQKTGIRGGIELHPHHILNFAQWPELRFAIDNGITLSKDSHREFHKIYGRKDNTRKQLIEFLKHKD